MPPNLLLHGIFGTPLNVTPLTEEAKQLAFSATIFHWGLNAWSVYAIIGLFSLFSLQLEITIKY